jgi:hypothetical protein
MGLKKAAPRMTVATLNKPSKRQLKPLASPGLRFGLLDGGVEFGESDMTGGEKQKAGRMRPLSVGRISRLDLVRA